MDKDAASIAIEADVPTRGRDYPAERARFDFWPVLLPGGEACAIGVDFTRSQDGRPAEPRRYIEAVCGYLAIAFR